MPIVALALLILCGLSILSCVLMMIKNEIAYRNCMIITDAIFSYRIDVIKKAVENKTISDGVTYEVNYTDMRDYNKIAMRIHDWGYKKILPADKFEIVKPYIQK